MPKLISVGELIDRSWEHYRRSLVPLLSIAGWAAIIAILFVISLAFYPTATKLIAGTVRTPTETFGVILFALTTYLVSPLLNLWIITSLTRMVHAQTQGKRISVKQAMQEGWTYFFPALYVSILVLLVFLAAVAIGFGPSALLGLFAAITKISALAILSSFLLVIGILVATVLTFLWAVHYFLAPYALLLDDQRGVAALKGSRTLVFGRFWSVLARLAIPKIVFVLVGVIVLAILYYVLNIFIAASAGLNLDVQLRLMTIATSVFPVLVAIVINPLVIIADVLLYNSLKETPVLPRT